MDKLKIAMISTPHFGTPSPRYGGAEVVCWDICNGLTSHGHKVVLIAPDESQTPKNGFLFKTGKASDTVNVNWMELEKQMWMKYDRYLDDFDLIMGSNWFGFEYASKMRNPKLKVCHLHHGGLNPEWWNRNKPPFKTNLIAISRWMKQVYASQNYESQVAYNPINTDVYQYKKEKGDRLLFVGRLDSFKQPLVAIQVAIKLGMGIDVVGGSFVSDTQYLNEVKSVCSIESNNAKLHLDATHEEKIKLYQDAKVVLFPSRFNEPYGLIVPETNSCGSFVIGLNDGAIPETIEEGVSGYVVSKSTGQHSIEDDVDAMVEGVKRLEREGFSPERCRESALRFSIDKCASRYEELFDMIIKGMEW